MSPPITTPHFTSGAPKSDFPFTQDVKPSEENFSFSPGSAGNAGAGFNHLKTGPEKSSLSSRSRPRLMKMRRRQVESGQAETFVKTDLGLGVLGGENRKLGVNGSAKIRVSNGGMEQLNSGSDSFGFGVNLNIGNGKSSVSSSSDSSKSNLQSKGSNCVFNSSDGGSSLNLQKEIGNFVFGAHQAGFAMNQNLPSEGFAFGPNKNGLGTELNLGSGQFVFGMDSNKSSGNLKQPDYRLPKMDKTQFVFASSKCASVDSASRVNLEKKASIKSDQQFFSDEVTKDNGGGFVFDASSISSNSKNHQSEKKTKPVKNGGNTVPDMRGKVKLDNSGESEKVGHSHFQFPVISSDSIGNNHVNFVFGSTNTNFKLGKGFDHNSTVNSGDMFNFAKSGKENAEKQTQPENACLNGGFVFGGLKGKDGLSSILDNDGSQVKVGNAGECNGYGQHVNNISSNINFKFQNSSSGGFTEEGCAFSLSDEMKKLNIDDSEVDARTQDSKANNEFVFGSNASIGKNSSHLNHSSHSNSESKSIPPFFSSVGTGTQPTGAYFETASTNNDKKDEINSTRKPSGLNFSDADTITPNLKFSFPDFNLHTGMQTADDKFLGRTRLKKKTGKSRPKSMVKKLFGQDGVLKEECSEKKLSSGCGSPMDFSPYRDTTGSDAQDADANTGVKGKFAPSEKVFSEPSEKPRDDDSNSNLSSSLSAQDSLSSIRHQYKKKYKLRVGSNHTVQGNTSAKENVKQEPIGVAPHDQCEHWRIRGNQAYHDGELSKAEKYYSKGINAVQHTGALGNSMKPFILCYSNRAATRMSLGRMREAIEDCKEAAALDPKFLKATSRAGNCYLVLGEVEDAIQCYSKCLNSGADVCLDRRATIEVADGLQKAKKVADYMLQCAVLLQEGTDDAVNSALEKITEALSISRFSEKLLEMKGKALLVLRMYDEVIKLCDQTLDIAEKNYDAKCLDDSGCKSSHGKLWRWCLQAKSHFHLGKLDLALELIEKQDKVPTCSKSGNVTRESSVALASTIRELLSLKKLGNDAFNSKRYTEAIENYTAAISKSYESRNFMAICFCNRAAACQSTNQIIDAIADCNLAIALDENYQKAISRRATLYETIRDYKQAACDLQRLVTVLANQSETKNQQHDSQSKSNGGSVRDLRKARRNLSVIEEKAKMDVSLDLYRILGIKASDTESEIKKAYRKAALRHHPDKVLARSDLGDNGTLWKDVGEKIHNDADRLFKIIGEAYAILSDPSKRSKYDNEEELRNLYEESSRNSNAGRPSTSYSSPYERGSWYGRQSGFSSSSERNGSSRRYTNFHSRW